MDKKPRKEKKTNLQKNRFSAIRPNQFCFFNVNSIKKNRSY